MKLHYNSAAVRESWEINSSFCRLSQIAQEDKNWQAANKFRTQLLNFLQIFFFLAADPRQILKYYYVWLNCLGSTLFITTANI